MKRTVPLAVGFLSGLIVVAKYFIENKALAAWGTTVVSWRSLVAAFALGVGTVNLVQNHLGRISRRQKGWDSSILLVASLVGFTFLGISKGTAHPVYKWGFDYLYQPIYSAISSLLAFMITSASYRAFKVKDWQAGVLMVTAVIVMLGQVGVGSLIYKGIPGWSSWIMSVVNTAGMRGITIGGALGAVALSLRVLLGLERGYLGGDR
ncbi:MAG: hypothetical protein ACM3WU_02350 [Bacillota bacterium]